MLTERVLTDLRPAADQVAALAAGIENSQMDDPTPCEDMSVAALLDHLLGLTVAFRRAARKEPDEPAPRGPRESSTALPADWRARLRGQLDDLVAAWEDPAAWEGEASVGGVTMPGAQVGLVALDELVLHGWDLAKATGQPFSVDPAHVEAVLAFTTAVAEAGPDGREGLFGPPVDVPEHRPAFDRALGLAGRDPDWATD